MSRSSRLVSVGPSIGCKVIRMCSTHVLRRQPIDPGDLAAQPLPLLVETPQEGRQPTEAALDQRHPQRREAIEDALDDQAHHLALEGLSHAGVLFEVVRGPAARGRRVAGRAAEVEPHGELMAHGRLKDRVILALAIGVRRAHRQKDLDEAGMVADAVDLPRRHLRLLARHDDRGAQAWLLVDHSAICQSLTALAIATSASGLWMLSTA